MLLIIRRNTKHRDHRGITEHLTNRSGDPTSQTIQTQRHGLIENEIRRDEPSLERLERGADTLVVRIMAIGIRKPGTGIDKGMLHPG